MDKDYCKLTCERGSEGGKCDCGSPIQCHEYLRAICVAKPSGAIALQFTAVNGGSQHKVVGLDWHGHTPAVFRYESTNDARVRPQCKS